MHEAGQALLGESLLRIVELWELHSRGYFTRPVQDLFGNVSGDVV